MWRVAIRCCRRIGLSYRNYPPRRFQSPVGGFSRRARSSRALSISVCAGEHLRLDIEFLARDEVEFGEETGHQGRAFFSRYPQPGWRRLRVLRRLLNSSNTLGSSMASVFRKTGVLDASRFSTAHQNDAFGGLVSSGTGWCDAHFRAPAMCADGP